MSWLLLIALRQERAYICSSTLGMQWVGAILDWMPSMWTSVLYHGKKEIIKEESTEGEEEKKRKEGRRGRDSKERETKKREGGSYQ